MDATQEADLYVRQMHVIWRDTFVVESPPAHFLETSRERLSGLPFYVSDALVEPASARLETLNVIERVSRNVAVMGYGDLLRFLFAPFEVANLRPTLARLRRDPSRLTLAEVGLAAQEADANEAWLSVTPMLLLHRAGIGMMQYRVRLNSPEPGYTVDEAIELVRMGIYQQLLRLPDAWHSSLPEMFTTSGRVGVLEQGLDDNVMIAGTRDLSQDVIAYRLSAQFSQRRKRRKSTPAFSPPRPTGSTSVIIVETNPQPDGDLAAFVAEHAAALRGIGALDTFYRERSEWIVAEELSNNLSADREVHVTLLGNSELILYDKELRPIAEHTRKRLRLSDAEHAITYQYMHYVVLMEWIYLQEAILRTYLQRLDALAATPTPRRRDMIDALQGAISDLVQYQENITPYATRVEFLERASAYHKLDQLAERFERKQDLLLSYASEFHDYREARATQFLNWLAGILTGAALADLIVTLAGITPQQPSLYLGITLGSVALVLVALAVVLRVT